MGMFKMFIVFAVFLFSFSIFPDTLGDEMDLDTKVCTKFACYHAALSFNSSIDDSIDPCDDFYEFVCSGWKKENNKIGKNNWDAMREQNYYANKQLQLSLGKLRGNETELERKVKSFYKGCLNVNKRTVIGTKPLHKLADKIEGWLLSSGGRYDWLDTLAWITRNVGLSHILFTVSVREDTEKYGNCILYLKSTMKTHGSKKRQTKQIEEFFKQKDLTLSPQETKDLDEFEKALSNLNRTLRYRGYCRKTICELQKILGDKVNISSYLQRVLEGIIRVTDETEVVVSTYVMELIPFVANTRTRIVAKYIALNLMLGLSTFTYPEFINGLYDIVKLPTHADDTSEQDHCLLILHTLMGYAMGGIYAKDNLKDFEIKDLADMTTQVQQAIEETIEESRWMDSPTQREAIRKALHMKSTLGNPEDSNDDTKLNEYYNTLEDINEDDFFQSAVNILRFRKRKELMKLNAPFKREDEIDINPTEISPFYYIPANSLFLPVTMNTFPFFNYHLPKCINFGSFGTIIGHEMMHAFDETGHLFDERGDERDWWTAATKIKLISKAQCYVNQYENYEPIEGVKLNGYQTLAENIADNEGIRAAFRAWKKYGKEPGNYNHATLPSLPYTEEQLFFITHAYMWCTNEDKEMLQKLINIDSHSPSKFRIIGSLSNNRDFHRAFNCTKGDKMYRENVCLMW